MGQVPDESEDAPSAGAAPPNAHDLDAAPAARASDADRAERMRGLVSAVMTMTQNLSLEAVLQRTVEAASELVDARYGAIGVLGEDQHLSHFVTTGMSPGEVEDIGALPHGQGVLGLLIRRPQALRLHDLRLHPDSYGFPPHHPQMRSFLGAPIRVRGKAWGNLYLTEKQGAEDFTLDDEEVVVMLAAAAGIAIENAHLYHQAERRQAWLQASVDIGEQLLGASDGEDVLGYICSRVLETAGSELVVVVGTPRGTAAPQVLAAAGAEAGSLVGSPMDASNPVLSHGLDGDGAQPAAFHHPVAELGFALPSAFAPGRGDACVIPLPSATGTPGALVLGRAAGRFADIDVEMAATVGAQVLLAQHIAAGRALRDRLAVLEDRERIASDLHDVVIQQMFAAGLEIQGLRRYTADPVALHRINAVTADIDDAIRELRNTIYSLREAPGTGQRLSSQLLEVVGDLMSASSAEPAVGVTGPIDLVVDEALGHHVLAVVGESVSNAARHAQADTVRVQVTATLQQVTVTVTDDGRGMPDDIPRQSGLANLRHRAEQCGGTFSIERPGAGGTRIVWTAPISRPGAAGPLA